MPSATSSQNATAASQASAAANNIQTVAPEMLHHGPSACSDCTIVGAFRTPCVGRSRFRLGALVPSVGAQAVLRLGMLQGQNVVEVYIPNIPAGFNFSTGSFEYVQIGWLDEDVGSFLAPYMQTWNIKLTGEIVSIQSIWGMKLHVSIFSHDDYWGRQDLIERIQLDLPFKPYED